MSIFIRQGFICAVWQGARSLIVYATQPGTQSALQNTAKHDVFCCSPHSGYRHRYGHKISRTLQEILSALLLLSNKSLNIDSLKKVCRITLAVCVVFTFSLALSRFKQILRCVLVIVSSQFGNNRKILCQLIKICTCIFNI